MNRVIPILKEEEFNKIEKEISNYYRYSYLKLHKKVSKRFCDVHPLILQQFIVFNAMRNLRILLMADLLEIKKEEREKTYNLLMEDFKKTIFERVEEKENS